jgi:hypothetical protein
MIVIALVLEIRSPLLITTPECPRAALRMFLPRMEIAALAPPNIPIQCEIHDPH